MYGHWFVFCCGFWRTRCCASRAAPAARVVLISWSGGLAGFPVHRTLSRGRRTDQSSQQTRTPVGTYEKTSLNKKYVFGYYAHLIVACDTEHEAVLLDDGTPNPEVLPAPVPGVSPTSPANAPRTTA